MVHIIFSPCLFSHVTDLGPESNVPVPLHNIDSTILKKVVEYCKVFLIPKYLTDYHQYHHDHPTPPQDDSKDKSIKKIEIIPWDQEFCTTSNVILFKLILAANYLDIKPLLDLGCAIVAREINGKTPEEIRKTFNIKNGTNYYVY
jgi:hypothetical protein